MIQQSTSLSLFGIVSPSLVTHLIATLKKTGFGLSYRAFEAFENSTITYYGQQRHEEMHPDLELHLLNTGLSFEYQSWTNGGDFHYWKAYNAVTDIGKDAHTYSCYEELIFTHPDPELLSFQKDWFTQLDILDRRNGANILMAQTAHALMALRQSPLLKPGQADISLQKIGYVHK
jgi:hypothetical protein